MNALVHYYAAAASAFHEIFYHKFPEIFRGIIPEKYRYFPRNFRKNPAGNFRTHNPMYGSFIKNSSAHKKQISHQQHQIEESEVSNLTDHQFVS